MIYTYIQSAIEKHQSQCAVVFCTKEGLLESARQVDEASAGLLSAVLKNKDIGQKSGQHLWLPQVPGKQPWDRVLLVQLGKAVSQKGADSAKFNETTLESTLEKVAKLLVHSPANEASLYLDNIDVKGRDGLTRDSEWVLRTLVAKTEYVAYRYAHKKAKQASKLKKLKISYSLVPQAKAKKCLAEAEALGSGVNFARELGNLPANICTPVYLADQAKKLAAQHPNLSAKSLTEKQMDKLGMHSLLSVSRGSDEEARLIIMEYKGSSAKQPHVLVGKGITFDTGGISLKPSPAMDEMKFDMCGAASVFGTIKALAEMKAKVHVVGIVAAAENMPSGRATKPGDVVTSMSGQTIEILNTDAEGRLVLCDALTYAERYKPKTIVDIATLTGAIIVALGNHASGLYANDQKLAESLLQSGERANDRAWQMPLWDDYQKQLDSNFADIANIGNRGGGSITAACFLSRFTKKQRWAHLDVAGSAFNGGTTGKGATGRPVPLLVDYVLNN